MCRLIKRERETVDLGRLLRRLLNGPSSAWQTLVALFNKKRNLVPISWLSASVAPKCGQPSLASEGDLVQANAVVVAAKLTIQNLKLLFTPKKAVKQHLDLLDKQHFDK